MEYAERISRIPVYLFAGIEAAIEEKKKQGIDVISFGIGDPDLPTPSFILETLAEEAKDPKNHNYHSSAGEPFFREAVVAWYKTRFGVDLNPGTQACNLIGSKEGIANIARAFVGVNDVVLVPDPAYPVYASGATVLCDGIPFVMPLLKEKGFLPDLQAIPSEQLKKAKLIYLNYPNNPTGAVASKEFLEQAVSFCLENKLLLCYDNAYSEFSFGDYTAPSILEFEGALDCAIEFHSCSKTFCMTGDRVGFAVGNEKAVAGLKKIKSNLDSGCPLYIQKAGAKALSSYTSREKPVFVKNIMKEYEERRNVLVNGLKELGFDCPLPKATFYVWVPIKGKSLEFAEKLIEVGVVATPGIGFGEQGEGFVRFALTQPVNRIKEALERMSKIL